METLNSGQKMISKKMLPISSECAVCAKFGNFSCERCGETYCSKMCQVSDWREHRRICMPIPRLLQRSEMNPNMFPINRMLMDGSTNGYDATDALGNISEHSAPSDSAPMTQEQVMKLTNSLNKMQLDGTLKNRRVELGASLSEIGEVLSTPPVTPQKVNVQSAPKVDENGNLAATANAVKPINVLPKPKQVVPQTLTPPKKQKNYNPSTRVVQSKAQVVLVHVENHQTVFVVPHFEIKEWQELSERTGKYAKEAKKLKNPPELGHIVLAKPKLSETYLRGLIKRIRTQDEVAQVEFLEYGFTDIVSWNELKCLSEELVNAPRLVNKCTLQGIPADMENAQEIVNYLTNLQDSQTALIVKQMEPIEKSNVSAHFSATLINAEKFDSINETIKKLKRVEPEKKMDVTENIQEPQPSNRQEIEFKALSGKNMVLYVLDNSLLQIGYFSAIKESDMALLAKNDAMVNNCAKEIEAGAPFHPREGETCLAQCADDKRWYRATAQQALGDGTYNLIYMDYGNMEVVSSDRIREMQQEFSFPCISWLCYIDGLNDKLSTKVVDRLKKLIEPYNRITFDEVQSNEADAVCKSSEIINALTSEGLI